MCNINSAKKQPKINNLEVLRYLRRSGYPELRIRRALMLLAGVERVALAAEIGVTPAAISQHITMMKYRRSVKVQTGISSALQVPREEFFRE